MWPERPPLLSGGDEHPYRKLGEGGEHIVGSGMTRIETFAGTGIRQATWDKVYEYLTRLPTKDGLRGPTAVYME